MIFLEDIVIEATVKFIRKCCIVFIKGNTLSIATEIIIPTVVYIFFYFNFRSNNWIHCSLDTIELGPWHRCLFVGNCHLCVFDLSLPQIKQIDLTDSYRFITSAEWHLDFISQIYRYIKRIDKLKIEFNLSYEASISSIILHIAIWTISHNHHQSFKFCINGKMTDIHLPLRCTER